MKKIIRGFLATIIMSMLTIVGMNVIPGLSMEVTSVSAAVKATLSNKTLSVPIGSGKDLEYTIDSEFGSASRQLIVNNKVKGATYSFSSSNTKIVTVDNKGILSGIKKGSATITCTQTLKGKKTKVGTCKVTVKDVEVAYTEELRKIALQTEEIVAYTMLLYKNPSAKYTIVSNDKNLTIQYDIYGDSIEIYGKAKKLGKYSISIKETYQKKTRTIATINVQASEMEFPTDPVDVGIGSTFSPIDGIIKYYNWSNLDYYFESEDADIVDISYDDAGYWWWYAKGLGSAKITVYEDSTKEKVLGTYTVRVIEIPASSISLAETYETYVGHEGFSLEDLYFMLDPYNTTDTLKIESSDPTIVSVENTEVEEYNSFGMTMKPLKEGKVTLTVSLGSLSTTCEVTVYGSMDDYYNNFY